MDTLRNKTMTLRIGHVVQHKTITLRIEHVAQHKTITCTLRIAMLYVRVTFLVVAIVDVLQCRPQLVKMLSDCQTVCIRMKCRVTRRLNRIQAVCI